jgi:HAD superfamily hydrolase (TIGR01484 family)
MRMVVTDLDGTLLDGRAALSDADRLTLKTLSAERVIRVVATGRSLYSAWRVLSEDFPIDYLIFSSGAGVVRWPSDELLVTHHMARADAQAVAQFLLAADAHFMLHRAIPDNHRFCYQRGRRDNEDFERRLAHYRGYAEPWSDTLPAWQRFTQYVVVERPGDESLYRPLLEGFPNLRVILTTSPLDHTSRWIEIFPRSVSKAIASAWVARRHDIDPRGVAAVGNDFNDRDLLAWSRYAYVVGNAPDALRRLYPVVGSNEASGFSEAVDCWMSSCYG